MTTLALLEKGRDLISDPAKFTQAAFARNSAGNPLNEFDPGAVCWCSYGALNVCAGSDAPSTLILDAVHVLEACIPREQGLTTYNDRRTHPEVIALWDQAIAREKRRV